MDVEREIKARFPGEKLKSSCRASIKPAAEQTEEEKAKRNRVFISNAGTLAVTGKKLVFFVDRRNYYAIMALVALSALAFLVFLLLGPLGILTLVAILMGAVVMIAIEAFVFMQMKNAAVIEFDRDSVSVEKDPAQRMITIIKGEKPGARAEKYVIKVADGEGVPEI